jgi:Mrp family chromosome partitioning ATPase
MSELETAIRKNKGTASALAGKDVSISRSQAETDIALKEFEALRERQQQALGGGKTQAINFKQTLVGQPALKPEPSGTIMNTLLAAAITFVLSCLVILITEFLNLSLKSPGLFKKILPQQLLASVGRQKLRKKDVFTFFAADQTPKHQKRYGSLINEINKLRFEIEKSGKRILLVTSTQPKQGKSTIVKLLAAAFGKINKKVLVIDANLSNNTLTGGAESVTALETIEVTADVKAEDLVKMAAVTTAENVWLIGCNGTGNAIEEVLPSNHLLKNRDLLLAAFDYVIIEGESLNNHIGSKELSGFADGVVAVFSAKAILKYPDEESINFLNSLDKKYVGNVLNKIEKGDMDI